MNDLVLTPPEAARMLRISDYTLRKWLRERKIPGGFKLGGHWMVRRAVLEEYLRNGR